MNAQQQQKVAKSETKESEGSWKVLLPVILLLLVMMGFGLSLFFKKKPGKKLSENKSLDKLNYVKDVPAHNEELDMDGLDDLSAEEKEYIMGVLQKTNVVHSNY
jgi:flagellar basal body-associated protein FliL